MYTAWGTTTVTSKDTAGEITRRDFLNGTLIGAGAALLTNRSLAGDQGATATKTGALHARFAPSGSPWTGYGGVGDYSISNGTTESVRDAGHRMRDGALAKLPCETTNENYDLVVVGGGFTGFAAAYEFSKRFGGRKRCLVLDNMDVFGGEAKQNDFVVDGQRITGPQGSSEFILPGLPQDAPNDRMALYWHELGIPRDFHLQHWDDKGSGISVPLSNYMPMYWEESRFSVGYYFAASEPDGTGQWVRDPWRNELATTPFEPEFRKELNDYYFSRRMHKIPASTDPSWLDRMTYEELLRKHLGFSVAIARFTDPLLAASAFGACSDVISAYAAHKLALPCTNIGPTDYETAALQNGGAPLFSFPGGNTGTLRYIVKGINPAAIQGDATFDDILYGPIKFDALDRAELPVRIRLGSTVFHVEHVGPARAADAVIVRYLKNGKAQQVRAQAVVMATGSWVTRHVVMGLPDEQNWALAQFNHGPMLVVNVALRNWQFMSRLGISAARWFGGFGWHASIRRTPIVKGHPDKLDPSQPIVLTLYTPILKPGHDLHTQGVLARAELLSKSYLDYDREIRDQLTLMFKDAGFDADRDIAGIVLNRWGHAYVCPQPGFFFGIDGRPSPPEVLRRQPFQRISFAHSELYGNQGADHAVNEGARAAEQAFKWLS